jgi:beta-lactamase regulating signal transducer with metallopeptidase domain
MSMPLVEMSAMVAGRVLNAVPGGLLIAALAWLVLRIAGQQNSKTRFAVWFCALIAVAGLPFLPSVSRSAGMQAIRSEIILPEFWAVAIFSAWILIAALATTRILAGLWKLRLLRNSSLPLSASESSPVISTPAIQSVVSQFQSARGIVVCSSSAVNVPTAIGFFRPAILIPEWVLRELSAEELKVVLLHEFAHLRRFDDWTNLLQKLVRTVFFFHPAVWWIEKKLSLEREMACDEVVLAQTANPQAYAECLVSLAEKSFVQRGLALAQAVIGRARDTSLRLARILDGNHRNSQRAFSPALGLAAVLAACSLIALPNVPRLIAFQDASSTLRNNYVSASYVQPQPQQAVVIPAAVRTVDTPQRAAAVRKQGVTGGIYHSAKLKKAPDDLQRDDLQRQIGAMPVMARLGVHADLVQPQFVFVMQTTQYDEGRPAVVRLCVWQVTFDTENRGTFRQEMIVRVL